MIDPNYAGYIEPTLLPHCIIGVEKGRQGITQTIPEDLVLDLTCGWMRVSEYHWHIRDLVDDYIKDVL